MNDIDLIAEAAKAAGDIALSYFGRDPKVWTKGEGSPVSEADIAIDQYLQEVLLRERPDYGWLSEETEDNEDRLEKKRIFIVDPIDGTRGFIERTENWMISVGVVEDGVPIAAALFGPAMDRLYLASKGDGATCNGEKIKPTSPASLFEGDYAIPARIATDLQDRLQTRMSRARYIHSLAYRIACVADGSLAGAIAKPSARDWDVVAADLILREAGGAFTDLDGAHPVYNRPTTKHGWLIAANNAAHHPLKNALLEAIEEQV